MQAFICRHTQYFSLELGGCRGKPASFPFDYSAHSLLKAQRPIYICILADGQLALQGWSIPQLQAITRIDYQEWRNIDSTGCHSELPTYWQTFGSKWADVSAQCLTWDSAFAQVHKWILENEAANPASPASKIWRQGAVLSWKMRGLRQT